MARPLILIVLAVALAGGQATAQPAIDARATALTQTEVTALDAEARRWTLSREEYTRYLDVLKGPRGHLSDPGITPIEVLGIEATSPAARARYARLWVDLIRADTAKVLAFTRSVHDAWRAVSPDRALIDPLLVARLKLRRPDAPPGHEAGPQKRLLMFLTTACRPCGPAAAALIQTVSLGGASGLDLYFLEADDDIAGIQGWAQQRKIPLDLVKAGLVTLNLDRGEFSRLQGPLGLADQLPVVLERDGERYEIVD